VRDEEELPPENDDDEFEGVYIVDDETMDLLQTVISVTRMAASVQVNEDARENLDIIASALAERFGIEDSMIVEEQIHTTDEGEEIIYKPKGGVFGDEPEEAEGPAPE
jgi:hypothetical protein